MNKATGDRNLLFGVLALQMDFISRDALVKAMQSWVADKSKKLGPILVEQGALSAARCALLEPLVEEHLQQHGDVGKSLAAVSPGVSAHQTLEQIANGDGRTDQPAPQEEGFVHTLQQITDPDVQASLIPFTLAQPTVGAASAVGLRFRILRPHAEGGLGKVSVARDQELHREVALKEIKERHADNPDSRARFLVEAEITGALEHPGVVPVYGLGTYADGRPFYAMRFIKGDTLRDAVDCFHKAEAADRRASERVFELRKLLGRFVDVCDAVAYAHSRGVLHRDLKPDNIMLGKYGETLVVDWGLAKLAGAPAEGKDKTEPLFQPSSGEGSGATQMGSAIGTPQYMPPEQAAGRLDEVGPASDVYSLGATLYYLLAGKPPFSDRTVGAVLQKVQRGEFSPPRQVNPKVPPALDAVCRKAMALRPEERYATPRALAGDIEKWLADEPVSAWREPWRVRMGRWARRHQTLVAATAAGLLVAILAGGAGAWLLERQALETRQAVETALGEVARLQGQARWCEARAVLDQAKRRLGDGGSRDLKTKLDRTQGELDLVERLDEIRLKKAEIVGGDIDLSGADQGYEKAFHEAGMAEVGGDTAAAAAWVNGSAVREAVIAALDDWASCTQQPERRRWILEAARRADPDPWRDGVRDPAVWDDAAALTKRMGSTEAANQSPQLAAALDTRLTQLGGDGEVLLRAVQERHPEDFWVNFDLGYALLGKKPKEAMGYFRAALAVRPRTAAVYIHLGNLLLDEGKREEATAHFHKAIELDPKYAMPHYNLGVILHEQGKREEATAEYCKAIVLDPKYALAHNNLGRVLYEQGKRGEATAEFRKAIELDPKLAMAHNNLGNMQLDVGKREEAAAEYRKAIELDAALGRPHAGLGLALFQQQRFSEARQSFQRSMDLLPSQDPLRKFVSEQMQKCERMLALDAKLPAVLEGNSHPADAAERMSLAELCSLKKRYADAARFYTDAFAAAPALADDVQTGNRCNAACAAALAAAGQGVDADQRDDKERARLRQQALEWLRADLALWSKQAENGTPQTQAAVQRTLRRWREDSDLAGVREATALEKLPESERSEWKKLWAEVEELVKRSEGGKK